MKKHLSEEYKRRSIVETVHLVLKRKSGGLLLGQGFQNRLKKRLIKDNSTQHRKDNNPELFYLYFHYFKVFYRVYFIESVLRDLH